VNIVPSEIAVHGETGSGWYITTDVPEPVTRGLIGVGMAGLGMRIRRRTQDA
jgi:hypothetical protein